VVTASLGRLAPELQSFWHLPVKYELTIVSHQEGNFVRRSLYYNWDPVAEWSDAGASVVAATDKPPMSWHDRKDELRDRLARLGRTGVHLSGWETTKLPSFDGHHWSGNYDGLTSVAREVTEMLEIELRALFDGLPI
jgi:hypothetical protein